MKISRLFCCALICLVIILAGSRSFADAVSSSPSPEPNTPRTMVGPPLAFHIVTEQDNETTVTLEPETRLIVHLRANPSTGYQWQLLMPIGFPLALANAPIFNPDKQAPGIVGAGGIDEFNFSAKYLPGVTQTFYLRLMRLRPFEKGVTGAKLFEIRVIIPPQWEPSPSIPH